MISLAPNLAYAISQATKWNLQQHGITIPRDLATPKLDLPFSISQGKYNTHECRAGVIDEFADGVPVFKELTVPKQGGGLLNVSTSECYWSGKIRIYHEADVPQSASWRRIHLLEALGFLGLYPSYGAVRYQRGTECWELFINPNGEIQTWLGVTHQGHHAGYTYAPRPGCIIEEAC
jgi:hypothetical protein